MKASSSSENDEQDRELIKLLKELGSLEAHYPPELLAKTRADFRAQVKEQTARNQARAFSKKDVVKRLKEVGSVRAEYPPELLAARRAAFLAQLAQMEQLSAVEAQAESAPEA